MKRTFGFLSLSIPVALAAGTLVLLAQVQNPAGHDQEPVGYTDTPVIPGQKWRVHDIDRPRPRHVTPGAQYGIRRQTRSCCSTARTSRSGMKLVSVRTQAS